LRPDFLHNDRGISQKKYLIIAIDKIKENIPKI